MPATAQFDEQQEYVSVNTAAKILAMPRRTVRHHCQMGRLPTRKVGQQWRIPKAEVVPKEESNAGA